MNSQALFGISALMSFLAFGVVTKIYIWPRLRVMRRADALIALVVPHTFRFIGLSFLIPRGSYLLAAIYQGQIGVHIGPGSLGAAYFIPTVVCTAATRYARADCLAAAAKAIKRGAKLTRR